MNLADIRTDYRRSRLRRADLQDDPIEQFSHWLEEACDAGVTEPTAMSLATAWKDGRPLVRTVLFGNIQPQAVMSTGEFLFTGERLGQDRQVVSPLCRVKRS